MLPQLTELRLHMNKIGDIGCTALAESCAEGALASLKKLYLSENQIGDAGVMAMANALYSRWQLENLNQS